MILNFDKWLNESTHTTITLNLPKDILEIHKEFQKAGFSLYVVGGAVRDAIMRKTPKDFDLATEANPDEVIKIARKNKWQVVEVGKAYGVVILRGHEIATFREDIGKGRRPDSVKFTTIEGDVKRRDLTINALFYDISKGEIDDLEGGKKDLEGKVIRTVGDPQQRFDEDPLRKLRALRFHALLGGNMDGDTLNALKNNPDISKVSPERTRDEFIKSIQKAKNTKTYLEICDDLGFLDQIFNGLSVTKDFINESDYILLVTWLLRDNDRDLLDKTLKNDLRWTKKELIDILFLWDMLGFNADSVRKSKIASNKTGLDTKQIIRWGTIIGKDFVPFTKFKLSLGGADIPKDLKGDEVSDWMNKQEAVLYKELL